MIWKSNRNRRSTRTVASETKQRAETKYRSGVKPRNAVKPRLVKHQLLERRELLAADPIHVGVVYLETDYLESDNDVGSDSQGDRFILSFTGGAANTQLNQLRISTDKDSDGISVGDPIFDTQPGGRGKSGSHGFQVVRIDTLDGRTATAEAIVSDGGQELILNLDNFRAGDRLEFTLDVDEVLRNALDLQVFNDRLDVITSGQEFQDSILNAVFEAPHYESASADAFFVNDFGSPDVDYGLDLPPDEGTGIDSRPNRSAAAVGTVVQTAKPIGISGNVWLDNNLDAVRQSGEAGIRDVELSLFLADEFGQYRDTGHRTTTSANGDYSFSKSLGLLPGTYRVVESQPSGLFSVASIPGSVNGQQTGVATSMDVLSGIVIPLGDTDAIEMNFAEAQSASIGGFVYEDGDNDGNFDAGEVGIAGVQIRLVPVVTVADQATLDTVTDSTGAYSFDGLAPGSYEIIEVTQPSGFSDGLDTAGTIAGQVVGIAENPGDAIRSIELGGGDTGINYNFGELAPGSLSGFVYLVAPGEDCDGPRDAAGNEPLAGVIVELQSPDGNVISRVTTSPMGEYSFDSVAPGEYRIVQFTPSGLIDGESRVGQINGVQVGDSISGSLIQSITMTPNGMGTEYNFCEIAPATISGYVYHDQSNDGSRDDGETGIAGASITLVNHRGEVVDTTVTDAQGRYEFADLLPGEYNIIEDQPLGYLDGVDRVGTVQGVPVGEAGNDVLRKIDLPQGVDGVEFNFGELLAASLRGNIHVDTDGDCIRDADEVGLGDVTMILLDADGNEVTRTQSLADGTYHFTGLVPGRYSVVQLQPEGLFDGGATAGSEGGSVGVNRIEGIDLGSGVDAGDYDFCENPPASVAGSVFIDTDGDCIRDANETGMEGVLIELRDASGQTVAATRTDAQGHYRFDGLRAGEYTVFESQPDGVFHGGQTLGSAGGVILAADLMSFELAWGVNAVDYDFCEQPPASLSGYVFIDNDGDCVRERDDRGIGGVQIQLRDADGIVVTTTFTEADGSYQFDGLAAGEYTVSEIQPQGFFQGGQSLGSLGGAILGVDLMSVTLSAGEDAVDYLFCEYEPGSISGSVWEDQDRDMREDGGEDPVEGVIIKLVDQSGTIVETTSTDALGDYKFENLPRGVYSVSEMQPGEYFHGGEIVGDLGGQISDDDLIVGIEIGGGELGQGYDFPEQPPATISGNVFVDGSVIFRNSPIDPADLRLFRDGVFTADDTPIADVEIQIRDAAGNELPDSAFLSGDAETRSVVLTDASGQFIFSGLRAGTYTLFQMQPDNVTDSLDTSGTTGGFAVNAADDYTDAERDLIDSIPATSQLDAILEIEILPGQHSQSNNFSEIVIDNQVSDFFDDDPDPIAASFVLEPDEFARPVPPFVPALPPEILPSRNYTDVDFVTWHLSVINGGYPRGEVAEGSVFRSIARKSMRKNWTAGENTSGKWRLMTMEGELQEASDQITLGAEDAVALVGDFDGDGDDEAAIFVGGEWFIDLNGNGVWDAGDLWVLLGTDMDRPVVGDWDGDGKDDIGIYGRNWEGDPERIKQDAGLPDPANELRRHVESRKRMGLVSAKLRTRGTERFLRRGNTGELRADAVDHVFQFGEDTDSPVSGDWNGDGIDQIGTFRGGVWVLDVEGDGRRKNQEVEFEFGRPGDQPVVGDFDGDGIDDVGVVRGNRWIIDTDGDRRLTAADQVIEIPPESAESQPVVGDWNGDGKDEPGYYDRQAG